MFFINKLFINLRLNSLSLTSLILLSTAFLFVALLHPNQSFALNKNDPKGTVKLRYDVNIYGSNLGEIHTTIIKKKTSFDISSITRAEGVASLVLGGDLIQKCSFNTNENHIISDTSNTEKFGRSAFKNTINIDWNTGFVKYNNQATLTVPTGYLVDFCNFQFAAAYTDLEYLKNNTIYVLDGKKSRVKAYIFKSISQEKLETPIGEFQTSKIVLERELNPEKSLTFWVTEKHPYFPLKMLEKRKSRDRVMTIKAYTPAS